MWYEDRLKVMKVSNFWSIYNGRSCRGETINQTDESVDIHFIVNSNDAPEEGYLAYATSCYSNFKTGRAQVGYIMYNAAYVEVEDHRL